MQKMKSYYTVMIIVTLILIVVFFVVFALLDKETQSIPVDTVVESGTSSLYESEEQNSSQITSSKQPVSSEITNNQKSLLFTAEEIAQINAVVEKYSPGVSVYFEDIHSSNKYTYNQDEKYFIASLIKAPYCMYLYQLASEGKCDLNRKLVFEEKHKQEGTGKLREMETPVELTIRELIAYSIKFSDNTAMKILLDEYSYKGYTEYAKKLGINYIEDVKYVVNGDICARDAGVYINAIYHFIETNSYGEELKKDMMQTKHPMIKSKYPIARKYGWAELSFHDFAVVYAPHPYVIAICTNKEEGKAEDYKLFAEITSTLEKMQLRKYELNVYSETITN